MRHLVMLVALLFLGMAGLALTQKEPTPNTTPDDPGISNEDEDESPAVVTPTETPIVNLTPQLTRRRTRKRTLSSAKDPLENNFMTATALISAKRTHGVKVRPFASMTPSPGLTGKNKPFDPSGENMPVPTIQDVPMSHNYLTPLSNPTSTPQLRKDSSAKPSVTSKKRKKLKSTPTPSTPLGVSADTK